MIIDHHKKTLFSHRPDELTLSLIQPIVYAHFPLESCVQFVCVFVVQIEVMHEESQGGSTHVVMTNETEESLSDRRR